jgi:hypothetical protein
MYHLTKEGRMGPYCRVEPVHSKGSYLNQSTLRSSTICYNCHHQLGIHFVWYGFAWNMLYSRTSVLRTPFRLKNAVLKWEVSGLQMSNLIEMTNLGLKVGVTVLRLVPAPLNDNKTISGDKTTSLNCSTVFIHFDGSWPNLKSFPPTNTVSDKYEICRG